MFPVVTAEGLAFDRRLDEVVTAEVGRFAILVVVLREVVLLLLVSRVPVGVVSRRVTLVGAFRFGGIPFLGEERIFFVGSVALREP